MFYRFLGCVISGMDWSEEEVLEKEKAAFFRSGEIQGSTFLILLLYVLINTGPFFPLPYILDLYYKTELNHYYIKKMEKQYKQPVA